jgi:hypothetical protein
VAALVGLPITLEQILRPLLVQLGGGPQVAIALMELAGTLGPKRAAQHLVPPLLFALCYPRPPTSQAPGTEHGPQ